MNNENTLYTECCRICLKLESDYTSLNTLEADNVKICDKLLACVPDIVRFRNDFTFYKVWLREGLSSIICSNCLSTLRIAYDFRILCLQSENNIQQYFSEDKCIKREPLINDVPDTNQIEPIRSVDKSIEQEQISDCINFKHFLDDTEPLETTCTENTDNLNNTPDVKLTAGQNKDEETQHRYVDTKSINIQTQPLPQYPTLTPTATRLESQQNKTVIVVEHRYKFSCEQCGKKYASNANLKVHMRTHTGEKPFECNYCEKRFYHSSHLREHIRRHTGEKPYQCSVCSKKFTITAELTAHMRIHTGEKPYGCEQCDKRYIKASDLQVHMRTHTGEKPFACNYCDKRFAAGYILNAHLKIHTGDRPWQCQQCPKSFTQASHLTVHMKKHTGEKFPCKMCGQEFAHSTKLTVHMREHKEQQPDKNFECLTCDKKFTTVANLQEHTETHTEVNLSGHLKKRKKCSNL